MHISSFYYFLMLILFSLASQAIDISEINRPRAKNFNEINDIFVNLIVSENKNKIFSNNVPDKYSITALKNEAAGTMNLGVFIVEDAKNKPMLVLKFLGLPTGWLDLSAQDWLTHSEMKKYAQDSVNTAKSEVENIKNAKEKLRNIKYPKDITLMLPEKILKFSFDHSLGNFEQYISVAKFAEGKQVKSMAESLYSLTPFREDAARQFATKMGSLLAQFHAATLETNMDNSNLSNNLEQLGVPKDVRSIGAQLHGDLKMDNMFLNGDNLILIDLDRFGKHKKLPIILDLVYFLSTTQRILSAGTTRANFNSTAFNTDFLNSYRDTLKNLSAGEKHAKIEALIDYLSNNYVKIKNNIGELVANL